MITIKSYNLSSNKKTTCSINIKNYIFNISANYSNFDMIEFIDTNIKNKNFKYFEYNPGKYYLWYWSNSRQIWRKCNMRYLFDYSNRYQNYLDNTFNSIDHKISFLLDKQTLYSYGIVCLNYLNNISEITFNDINLLII